MKTDPIHSFCYIASRAIILFYITYTDKILHTIPAFLILLGLKGPLL